jgi:hypothetical protein
VAIGLEYGECEQQADAKGEPGKLGDFHGPLAEE